MSANKFLDASACLASRTLSAFQGITLDFLLLFELLSLSFLVCLKASLFLFRFFAGLILLSFTFSPLMGNFDPLSSETVSEIITLAWSPDNYFGDRKSVV